MVTALAGVDVVGDGAVGDELVDPPPPPPPQAAVASVSATRAVVARYRVV
jgi:hypothetical protein